MEEEKIINEETTEEAKATPSEQTDDTAKKSRRPGGNTGEQFVKSIGVAGCIFFLSMFIIFLVFCFTSGSRAPASETPQLSFCEFSPAVEELTNG